MLICNDYLKHELEFLSNELKRNDFVQIRPVRTYSQPVIEMKMTKGLKRGSAGGPNISAGNMSYATGIHFFVRRGPGS